MNVHRGEGLLPVCCERVVEVFASRQEGLASWEVVVGRIRQHRVTLYPPKVEWIPNLLNEGVEQSSQDRVCVLELGLGEEGCVARRNTLSSTMGLDHFFADSLVRLIRRRIRGVRLQGFQVHMSDRL